ncbi:Retrovirus-related Pol polyprotein from transposon TNT 1-94 [Vitis vinifera]|uniref:Retrovirus-related Pol polyprotein from transposon TNT 1-94 n=1 Tax=Vitis vinifera TaxID=29760 RepID=A0A438DHR2_VITVI|nr:Retrovirus-related Pol polyprotein from transposon TNT 1-94 [Vitis vinifera]
MVKDSMFNEEAKRKELGISSNTEAPVIERRGRSKNRKPSSDYNRDKSRGKSNSRKEIKCFYYGKPGHIKRECRKFKKEQFKGNGEVQKEDKDIAVVASNADTIIVCDDACVNLACQDSTWVVDTTTSFHITACRDFFSSYTSGSFGWVRMRNEAKCEIVGMRDVELKTSIRFKLVLKDVRHVPEIRFSFISVGKLDDEGYHSHLREGKWKLTKGSLVLARGKKNNDLYKTKMRLVKGEVNIVENEASIELWHKRLGQTSKKGLQVLAKKKLLPVKVDTDVSTMKSNTLGGTLYYVTFIDDHLRKVWPYALKSKDHVLDVFKDFHVKIERQTGK